MEFFSASWILQQSLPMPLCDIVDTNYSRDLKCSCGLVWSLKFLLFSSLAVFQGKAWYDELSRC